MEEKQLSGFIGSNKILTSDGEKLIQDVTEDDKLIVFTPYNKGITSTNINSIRKFDCEYCRVIGDIICSRHTRFIQGNLINFKPAYNFIGTEQDIVMTLLSNNICSIKNVLSYRVDGNRTLYHFDINIPGACLLINDILILC